MVNEFKCRICDCICLTPLIVKGNNYIYCSLECKRKYNLKALKVKCKNCGIVFQKTRSAIKRTKNNFCTTLCVSEYKISNSKITTRFKIKDKHICRVVSEKVLNRKLLKTEIVHHIDENPRNNSIENLVVLPSIRFHYDVHRSNKNFDKYKLMNIIKNGETKDIEPVNNSCIKGHEFTKETTYFTKTGRGCRICVNANTRARRKKERIEKKLYCI